MLPYDNREAKTKLSDLFDVRSGSDRGNVALRALCAT